MAGVNFAVLVGRVGGDPEIKALPAGGKVARFSLATSESWKDSLTGEKKERTEWHSIVAFSEGLVGVIERYVRKGSKLYVRGMIRTRKWQDNHGNDRYTTEIHLSGFDAQLQLLDSKGSGRPPAPEEDGYGGQRSGGAAGSDIGPRDPEPRWKPGAGAANFDTDLDDEVPF